MRRNDEHLQSTTFTYIECQSKLIQTRFFVLLQSRKYWHQKISEVITKIFEERNRCFQWDSIWELFVSAIEELLARF